MTNERLTTITGAPVVSNDDSQTVVAVARSYYKTYS